MEHQRSRKLPDCPGCGNDELYVLPGSTEVRCYVCAFSAPDPSWIADARPHVRSLEARRRMRDALEIGKTYVVHCCHAREHDGGNGCICRLVGQRVVIKGQRESALVGTPTYFIEGHEKTVQAREVTPDYEAEIARLDAAVQEAMRRMHAAYTLVRDEGQRLGQRRATRLLRLLANGSVLGIADGRADQ